MWRSAASESPAKSTRLGTDNPGSSRGRCLQLERRPSSASKTAITRLANQGQIRYLGKVVARTNKSRVPALAYYRTESRPPASATKTARHDKRRLRAAPERAGFEIVAEFYDAAVSGADPIQDRPGFAALLDRIEGNGVRTVIVEDASRFARELMAQELGIPLLSIAAFAF